MPWNPIARYPQIFDRLKREGKTSQATTDSISNATQEVLGIVNEKTVKNHLETMHRLGYIKEITLGVWELSYWDRFKTEKTKKAEQEVDELLEEVVPSEL